MSTSVGSDIMPDALNLLEYAVILLSILRSRRVSKRLLFCTVGRSLGAVDWLSWPLVAMVCPEIACA